MQLFQSAEQFQDENVVMVLGVEAARVWEKDVPAEEQKQRLNGDKVPVWEITCAVQDGWLVAGIKVRVASETKPAVSCRARSGSVACRRSAVRTATSIWCRSPLTPGPRRIGRRCVEARTTRWRRHRRRYRPGSQRRWRSCRLNLRPLVRVVGVRVGAERHRLSRHWTMHTAG